jgi:hypothetical protein
MSFGWSSGGPKLAACPAARAAITAYLQNGGTLEKAQQIANHESPRTTKLYDRSCRPALKSWGAGALVFMALKSCGGVVES